MCQKEKRLPHLHDARRRILQHVRHLALSLAIPSRRGRVLFIPPAGVDARPSSAGGSVRVRRRSEWRRCAGRTTTSKVYQYCFNQPREREREGEGEERAYLKSTLFSRSKYALSVLCTACVALRSASLSLSSALPSELRTFGAGAGTLLLLLLPLLLEEAACRSFRAERTCQLSFGKFSAAGVPASSLFVTGAGVGAEIGRGRACPVAEARAAEADAAAAEAVASALAAQRGCGLFLSSRTTPSSSATRLRRVVTWSASLSLLGGYHRGGRRVRGSQRGGYRQGRERHPRQERRDGRQERAGKRRVMTSAQNGSKRTAERH